MDKINLLLIGNHQLKKYFSDRFNVFLFNLNNLEISSLVNELKIDVILQVENLGQRQIILDISNQNCLKIFWAIDIHLNYYWQKYYFENFDIILTTQKNFVKIYSKKIIFWLPWGISDEYILDNFIPFSKRKYEISFVGLIDKNRVKRSTIINEIKDNFCINIFGDNLKNRLDFTEMLNVYRNSMIVINESIYNDINFRYFEVTSQGALLYSEKINNGEDELFQDKEEVLYYSQLNLISRLKYFLKYPERIENIAYNGWKRTKIYHKLSDRVKQIEAVIFKNIDKFEIKKANICYPLTFTYLRAIGNPSYKDFIIKNCNDDIIQIIFLKNLNKKLFIEASQNYLDNEMILLNLIPELIENNEIEALEKMFKEKDILKIITKFIIKNLNKIPKYHLGYLNAFSKNRIFLSIYELINYIFDKFPEKAMKNRDINYIGGRILFEYKNFYGAIGHFLNLQREFPENVLFRKYLATCYYKIFQIELFWREVLKIFILEKKFSTFKKLKIDNKIKKEVLYELITNLKNKKFIRDIMFNLSDFY